MKIFKTSNILLRLYMLCIYLQLHFSCPHLVNYNFIFHSYYRVVSLIPIFQYSNVYTPTPKIKQLTTNVKLQEECLKYVSNSGELFLL